MKSWAYMSNTFTLISATETLFKRHYTFENRRTLNLIMKHRWCDAPWGNLVGWWLDLIWKDTEGVVSTLNSGTHTNAEQCEWVLGEHIYLEQGAFSCTMQKVPAGQSCESRSSAAREDKAPPQASPSASAPKPEKQEVRRARLFSKEPFGQAPDSGIWISN